MSFPDDLPVDWDRWFNEEIRVSPLLAQMLGPGISRISTLLQVARNLSLDPETITNEGLYVLERLRQPLEDLLAEDPGDWASDLLALRGDRIVRAAVGDITSLDALVGAMKQFGWGKTVIGRSPVVRDLERAVREELVKLLAQRVYKMLDAWRKRDAWNANRPSWSQPSQREYRASTREYPDA